MANERILIVDDESSERSCMTAALDGAHYRPVAVPKSATARLTNEPHYDLILAGAAPGGLPDLALIGHARALCPDTPLIALTATRDVNAVLEAIRHGAGDCLLQPCDRDTLLAAVVRSLEHRRTAQQNALDRQNLEQLVAARTELLRNAIADLEQAYDITLEALGDALDLKDAETEGHSRRVTAYTIALARAMGLTSEAIRVVARGAFLHDIGKMAIPDAILLKPGKLDRHEQAMMREHCARGYQILKKIPFLQDAAQIVYSHQEHFDGSGYPRRLKGEEIVLGARIFSVADTLDAITSDRPYRRANSFDAARVEILRCAGTQFDPTVVQVFDSLPNRLWEELRAEIKRKARLAVLSARN